MRRVAVLCALLTAAVGLAPLRPAGSLEPGEASSPQRRASAFLARVAPGSFEGAAAELLGASPLARANPALAAQLESRLQAMVMELGASLGHELVTEKLLGTSLMRLVYLLKFESRPAVFEFFFYRARDSWEMVLLNIEADIGKLRGE